MLYAAHCYDNKKRILAMPMDEIEIIKQRLIEQVNPTCIYLFGSFANGKVRRAKLYYLRDRLGKAAKVKEKV